MLNRERPSRPPRFVRGAEHLLIRLVMAVDPQLRELRIALTGDDTGEAAPHRRGRLTRSGLAELGLAELELAERVAYP